MTPPLTLPLHQLITPTHPLCNISPPLRLPFHCTLIPHHYMLSLLQPAHSQSLHPQNLQSHSKHTILLFPASSSRLNPTPHTSIPRMGTSEQHKGVQLRMTIIFFYGKWCTTTEQRQHDGGDESNSSFLGQTNLYSIISCNIQGNKITKYNWYLNQRNVTIHCLNWQIMKIH